MQQSYARQSGAVPINGRGGQTRVKWSQEAGGDDDFEEVQVR